jgi:hypothetical protein
MENEEKLMTGEESLKIITDMINKTKVNVQQSSFHLLFWGWLILAISLSEYLMWHLTDYANPWIVWYLTIPGVFVSMIYGFVNGRKAKVHTYADMIFMWSWMAFLFAAIVLFIIIRKDIQHVAPYILTLAAMPTFISGCIIRYKPLIFGGASFWILALIASFAEPEVAPLAVPVAMVTGYLIPGYLLRKKDGHDTV